MRTILVAGGAGFIGHHLVKKLVAEKYRVIVLDNLSNSNQLFIDEVETKKFSSEEVFLLKRDIRIKDAIYDIFQLEDIDTCVHLAAKISVQDSILQPYETIDVNVRGTLNVLQACCDNNVGNFIFASSAAVYGHPNELPISENHVTQPISPYGASKVAGEALVSSFSSKLGNSQILRFFNVYGEGQTQTYAGVITRFRERLSSHLPPIIYGKGIQTRDFIHVNDIVQAIILAADMKPNRNKLKYNHTTLNIGTGRPTTILELSHIMTSIFGLKEHIEPIFSGTMEGDIVHSVANIKRATEILNFSPKEDLRSGLLK